VNDVAGGDATFASNGPRPQLNSGQVPAGKTVSGWILYEVPKSGRITIAYQPGRNSIFEVTLGR